jgi:hypothetical protein
MKVFMFCMWCYADPVHIAHLFCNMMLIFGFNFKPFTYFYVISLGKCNANQMCFILLWSVEVNNTWSFISIFPIWLCSTLVRYESIKSVSCPTWDILHNLCVNIWLAHHSSNELEEENQSGSTNLMSVKQTKI